MANAIERVGTFMQEVREELGRVSWPTREELVGAGLVVFVGVALLAIYIAAWDFLLSQAAQWLLR
jgi:preprotein translocase subunit SecE